MADADWTGYVGMATGIFGAVTGFLGYRRANQIKSLDLRLELRKVLSDAHDSLSSLPTLIEEANGSRHAVLAAKGLGGSGNKIVWDEAVAADRAQIDRIAPSLPSEGADFSTLSSEHLEAEIVAAHKIKTSLSGMVAKYRAALAADSEDRKQIAHQVTAMTAARIAQATKP
ncbi:hypothetical protein [Paraburkholderia mimosarum]|nr:hypothetical protein [Paraburkholderia mimosarum]